MNQYTVKNWLWVAIILMFIVMACLTGCGTVSGMGKDLQDSAEWTRSKMSGESK
jgi:predicted small secreted protein